MNRFARQPLTVSIVLCLTLSGCGGSATADGDADFEADPDPELAETDGETGPDGDPGPPSDHPRLVMDEEKVADLKGWLAAGDPFVGPVVDGLRATAGREPRADDGSGEYDPYRAVDEALIAKSAAFLHLLGLTAGSGQEYRDRALRLLDRFETDLSMLDVLSAQLDKTTIHGSEAIISFCEAFDFLAAAGAFDGQGYATARERILALTRSFYDAYFVRMPYVLSLTRNNHAIKAASGIGMSALLFPDDPDAPVWLDHAASLIDGALFGWQICPGGAFAEGPAYFQYTMINLRPFALALHRRTGGTPLAVDRVCAGSPPPCTPGGFSLPDILTSPALAKVREAWLPGLLMDNGYLANVDDADWTSYNFAFDYYCFKSPAASFGLRQAAVPLPDLAFDGIDTLAVYDPATSVEPLERPVAGLQEGYARLMAGDAMADLTLFLIGEQGPARSNGMGHEQPDNQSVIVTFGGETWLLDSGYIAYAVRGRVALDVNHNVILVDGRGGPTDPLQMSGTDDDATLEPFADGLRVPNARVSLVRSGVSVERAAILPGPRTVLIADSMVAGAGADHSYTLLFHLNGGGSAGGTVDVRPDGGSLTRGSWRLDLSVATDGIIGLPSTEEMTHSFIRLPKDAEQQTHLRLALPVDPPEGSASVHACTRLRLVPAGVAYDDPALRISVVPAPGDGGEPFCDAVDRDGEGPVRVFVLNLNAPARRCFDIGRDGARLATVCGTALLFSVTDPGGPGQRVESLGPGEAAPEA